MDVSPIYGIDVSAFRDANDDGIGDLQGVIESLDYVQKLGAGWIWLLPFYPSPLRDNGYDVTDYYGIDPRFGSFGDFVELIDEARRRKIRVLIDLVINHTSDRHPWFLAARTDPRGPFRDYYTWNDAPPPLDQQPASVFPDRVPSVWTWDEAVGSFFFHQFYPFQPTLNHANPKVNDEIRRMIAFWQELGVSGFRIDAAGHIGEPALEPGSPEAIAVLERYRSYVGDHHDTVLLGEADLPADRLKHVLGPNRLQWLFDFIGNANMFLAFVTESASPIVRAHNAHGPAPEGAAWVHFLRNLDEVDLERLSDDELETVMRVMAPEKRMRIFGRGVRRRLAPMLEGDPRRLRLAFSVLLAHPGAPMIVYGDEIGMGDDQELPERQAVRTAMQWTDEHNAGFTHAPDDRLRVPLIRDGRYGASQVNVADQERSPDSLLCFVREALAVHRRTVPIRGAGTEMQSVADERVLLTRSRGEGARVVTLANLSSTEVTVDRPWDGRPAELLLGTADGLEGDGPLRLPPYGFCWVTVAGS